MLNVLLIALGGALGSVCRYAMNQLMPWEGLGFPTATFFINIIASFLMGLLMGLLLSKFTDVPQLKYFAIIGFCGGFSTFSTFAFEAFKLNQNGTLGIALVYTLLSVFISISLIFIGYSLTSTIN